MADSYDAMRSRRIYRNALPDEEIRRELLDNCSTQFDPQISCMFVDMLDNGMVVIDDERVIIRTKLEKPSKIKGLALI